MTNRNIKGVSGRPLVELDADPDLKDGRNRCVQFLKEHHGMGK